MRGLFYASVFGVAFVVGAFALRQLQDGFALWHIASAALPTYVAEENAPPTFFYRPPLEQRAARTVVEAARSMPVSTTSAAQASITPTEPEYPAWVSQLAKLPQPFATLHQMRAACASSHKVQTAKCDALILVALQDPYTSRCADPNAEVATLRAALARAPTWLGRDVMRAARVTLAGHSCGFDVGEP